ncbi:hypothetical protein [Microbacterium sp. NIBRBAC000506063]|uniref:hypothetical protein n=1 Tax=Microbacterium sp. NIBRBAC000506063 TaxID=2734618 RepID=UPI002948C370|nr:hypothetical protein [Microbacterium sp. NIBRBAC000506063]
MNTQTLSPRTGPWPSSATDGIRPRLRGVTAESIFVGRSMRHSLRDGESLLMAIMLPVMLMLLFTWVFGGALDATGGYVDYVVPGSSSSAPASAPPRRRCMSPTTCAPASSTASARCRFARERC